MLTLSKPLVITCQSGWVAVRQNASTALLVILGISSLYMCSARVDAHYSVPTSIGHNAGTPIQGPAENTPAAMRATIVTNDSFSDIEAVTPTRAWDFLNSAGVNTHFSYTDTLYYKQPDRVLALLRSTGIRHIRDGVMWGWIAPNLPGIQTKLAAAGIGGDFVLPNPDAGTTEAALFAEVRKQPAVEALEAPNEWDQAGGKTWASTLKQYMPIIQRVAYDVKVPLYGPSLTRSDSYPILGDIGSFIAFNNEHNYWGGRNPETTGWGGPNSAHPVHYYGALEYDFDQSAILAPGTPIVQTETGYVARNAVTQNIISEATEAIYEPRLLLHSWNKGVRRTYIYELMDEPSSPTGYGLLRGDLTPRPAFTALASLLSLVADTQSEAPLQPLRYSLSGKGLETTLLEKRDGSYLLAIWNPSCIWDVNELKVIHVPLQVVTLTLAVGNTVQQAFQFDDSGNTSRIEKHGASVSFDVGSAVTLISIK